MQRLKRTIRKIGVLGTGLAMLGASMSSALALDLADLPAPFVVDGQFQDSAIVVGERAAAADTLGAIDIAKMLQFNSKICVPSPGVGGGVSISGDAVEIGDSSDLLELRERLGDVRETFTELDLDGLRGGIVTTNEGTTEFNQYLRFEEFGNSANNTLKPPLVNFTRNDAPVDEVGDWLVVQEGSTVNDSFFEYEIEFEDGLESDIVSSKLDDLEDEEIVILGTTYTFVDTSVDTAKNDVTLELLGGAIYAVMEEGEVKTFTINGKEYEINVLIIEDAAPATVTFEINGEISDQLVDGETEVLRDGTLVGISDIVLNEAGEAGSGDIVEVYIGATKLELRDSNYTDSENSGPDLGFERRVEIDEESIEDAAVQMKANELSSTKLEISSIKYRLTADALPGYRDVYVPPGHGVREFLDEPQGMLGLTWDIRYEGLDETGVSVIKFDPSGDDEYDLEFENREGLVYKVPYVSNEGNFYKYGDDNDDLVFVEGNFSEAAGVVRGSGTQNADTGDPLNNYSTLFNIGLLDYFILSDADKNPQGNQGLSIDGNDGGYLDDTAFTHVIRYNSIDRSDQKLSFDDEATGSREFTFENSTVQGIIGKAELVFGGNTFQAFISNQTEAGSDNPLVIDMTGDGDIARDEVRITVNGGGILDLGNSSVADGGIFGYDDTGAVNWTNRPSQARRQIIGFALINKTFFVNLTTLSENFDENRPSTSAGLAAAHEHLRFAFINRTGNRIGVETGSFNVFVDEPDEDDDNLYGMSDYGVYINVFDPEGTDDAETITLEYPLVQRGARVFLTFGDTKATKTAAGEVCSVADIQLAAILDSEVSDPTAQHLILVGGPCANDLVAQVAGFPSCDEWTMGAGEGLVQLAQNGDNVAMLVAGTDAIDTRVASKVVAGFGDYALSGEKAATSGSLSSPTVA